MAIDKMKLFEGTKGRWPPAFRITPTRDWRCYEAEPELVAVYNAIDESCNPVGEWTQNDEWIQLANWAFHEALRRLAVAVATERVILRDDVTFDMFDVEMRRNLADESWAEERQMYENSPRTFPLSHASGLDG